MATHGRPGKFPFLTALRRAKQRHRRSGAEVQESIRLPLTETVNIYVSIHILRDGSIRISADTTMTIRIGSKTYTVNGTHFETSCDIKDHWRAERWIPDTLTLNIFTPPKNKMG